MEATLEREMNHDMQAHVNIILPVDLEGTPFYLYSTPQQDGAEVDFYVCSCGEQFGQWEDAQNHRLER